MAMVTLLSGKLRWAEAGSQQIGTIVLKDGRKVTLEKR
jgi:hypothetical protein